MGVNSNVICEGRKMTMGKNGAKPGSGDLIVAKGTPIYVPFSHFWITPCPSVPLNLASADDEDMMTAKLSWMFFVRRSRGNKIHVSQKNLDFLAQRSGIFAATLTASASQASRSKPCDQVYLTAYSHVVPLPLLGICTSGPAR